MKTTLSVLRHASGQTRWSLWQRPTTMVLFAMPKGVTDGKPADKGLVEEIITKIERRSAK